MSLIMWHESQRGVDVHQNTGIRSVAPASVHIRTQTGGTHDPVVDRRRSLRAEDSIHVLIAPCGGTYFSHPTGRQANFTQMKNGANGCRLDDRGECLVKVKPGRCLKPQMTHWALRCSMEPSRQSLFLNTYLLEMTFAPRGHSTRD
jgi:hypothetical protein